MEGNAKSSSQKFQVSCFRFQDKGQTLVELLLALGIFAFIMTAVFALVFGGLTTGLRTEEQDYATMYAQEGLDAARSIRDTDWDSFAFTSTPLAIGKTHGVELDTTNGGWKWKTPLDQSTSDEISFGARKFTREIFVEDVWRTDPNSDGILDDIFTGSNSVDFDYNTESQYVYDSAGIKFINNAVKLKDFRQELTPYIDSNTKALYHFNKSEGDELDIGVPGNLTDDDLGGASETNLKGLWHLNESGDTAAPDSSLGNLNPGTLNNAVLNPSFETFTGTKDDTVGDTFTNWFIDRSTGLAVSGAYDGSTAVRLKYSGSGDNYMTSDWISPSGGVGGKTYQLTFWAKATAAASVSSIALQSWGPDWTGAEYLGPGSVSLTTSWQKFTYTATFTNARNSYRVVLRTSGNTGIDVFYDKVSVGGPSWTTAGKFSNALSFDGVDDYVSAGDSTDLRISNYTVEAWIKPNGAPNEEWKGIIGKPGRNFNIWLNNAGYIHHRFHNSASTNSGTPNTPAGSITWDKWNHIAITNDGTTAKTYINGVEQASGSSGGAQIIDNTTLYIGRNLDGGNGNYFNGSIDEVAVYNTALLPAQIKEHYQRGIAKDAEKNGGGQNWQYQRAITITGSTSGALYNYQIPITLTTTEMGNPYTNVNANGSDIRFTNSAGDELSYWIETWNNAGTSKIWVKADYIPASLSTATIYMYYGNTAATSASNGNDVFEFFDDFTGTTISTAKWAETDTGGNISQNNEIVIANGTGAWGPTALFSQSNFARGNKEFWYKFRPTCTTGASYTVTTMLGWKDVGAGTGYVDMLHAFYWVRTTAANSESFQVYEDGTGRGDVAAGAPDFTCGTQYWGKVALKATGADYYTSTDGTDWTLRYTGTYSSETPLKVGFTNYQGGTSYFDNAFIRQYASSEPTIGTPGTATAGTYNLNLKGDHGQILGPITATSNTGLKEALSFDGVDDYVDLPTLTGIDATTANAKTTVEFWMYWDGVEGKMPFGFTSYDLYFTGGSFGFNTANSDLYGIVSTGLANRWVHVAAIFNNGAATANSLYIDGVAQTLTQRIGTSLSRNVATSAKISGWNNGTGYKFGGKIDEVAIWNKALTQEEVWAHMAQAGYQTNTYATVKYNSNPPGTPNKDTLYIDRFKEFVETATIPPGTSIDYQLSIDNCNTMKYWDGDSWENAGGWNDARTITRYLNFLPPTPTTPQTICLSARLNTTDTNQTPVLDNVEIKYSQNRDAAATLDTHTRRVTSRVKWPSGFSFQDVQLAEYLTDWNYNSWTQTTYNDFSVGSTIIPAGCIDIKDSANPDNAGLGSLIPLFSSWTQTNDTTTSFGFNFTGNGGPAVEKVLSSTVILGTSDGASVSLSPGTAPYNPSGTYTSGVLNTGQASNFTTASWTASTTNTDTFTHTSDEDFNGTTTDTVVSGGSVKLFSPFDRSTEVDGSIDLSKEVLSGSAKYGGCTLDDSGATRSGTSWTGSTCTINTTTKATWNFTTVNIPSTYILTTSGTTNPLTIKASGNVTIAGSINLDGKGNIGGPVGAMANYGTDGSGTGYGAGGAGASSRNGSGGGGGAYGNDSGAGGSSKRLGALSGGAGNSIHGSSTAPTAFGAGGGGAGGGPFAVTGGAGGAGGGAVKIITFGTITINGSITANGIGGTDGGSGGGSGDYTGGGGGGSGGSIWIQANTVTTTGGTPTITANGGGGGAGMQDSSCTYYSGAGGGGSGGRIAIDRVINSYTGSIYATNGNANGNGGCSVSGAGGTGTVSPNNLAPLVSTGTYTSLPQAVGSGTISWTETLNDQTIAIKTRSCDDANCSIDETVDESTASEKQWANINAITSGSQLASSTGITQGDGWIQYEVTLSTTNTAVTPTLDSVTTTTIPLVLEMRAGNVAIPEDCPPICTDWTGWTEIGSGATQSGINLDAFDGNQYIQYRAKFSTVNTAYTPSLDEVVANYFPNIATSYSFVSKELNTGISHNFYKILWNEYVPLGTSIDFQLATAPDNGNGSPGAWTAFMGPAGTGAAGDVFSATANGCSKSVNVVTCLIPSTIEIGNIINDQWVKYKAIFTSNGESPILYDVNVMHKGGY